MPLKIMISGSSGFIGSSLSAFFKAQGHIVIPFIRGSCHVEDYEGLDVVIHLAGENIAKGFWSANKKKRILESRTIGTTHLVERLKQTRSSPKLFISASAIGYYGNQKDSVDETKGPGTGFLSEVCQAWEEAVSPLQEKGVRVVLARLGMVLSPKGGLLKALMPTFQLGLGAQLGTGQQIISWIALEDLIAAFYHIILHKNIKGPVNIVSPYAVSQKVFAQTLSRVLSKPCILSFPRWLFWGEKSKELLFSSLDVKPSKLYASNFYFLYPTLTEALQAYFKDAFPKGKAVDS